MNEYTPTEGDVIRGHKFPFPEDTGISIEPTGAQVARAIAKIKANAWDDGYAAGQTDYDLTRTNPYREDEP